MNSAIVPARSSPTIQPQAAAACTDTTDSDGDGLANCEEQVLGIDPATADTDGDLLDDGQEVRGFAFGGKQWYSDPQKQSTLNDSILDGQKCASERFPNCADSDSDGTPDLFDRDIDGDSVPNTLDQSPFRKNTTVFSGSNPMQLVVNNLEANRYTYVEFQLRPSDPKHLWYAFNVLDWPDGDNQGQIQRDANAARKTFFDVCEQAGRTDCKMSPDDNGDIKLVPMLEIEAPAQSANLPQITELINRRYYTRTAQEQLDKFGIATKAGPDGTTYMYVPLQLVTDSATGDRAAFYGKMLYQPQQSWWGGAHKLRLAWTVQMLVDVCQQYAGSNCTSYVGDDGRDYHNQTQIVQTYYDDWSLTSLNVRENRGTDYAIVYEDPAVDPNLNLDGALIPAAIGLDSTFMGARDCDTVNAAVRVRLATASPISR